MRGGVTLGTELAVVLTLGAIGFLTARPQPSGHNGAVEIQMRNVDFLLASDIVLEIHALRGQLRPTRPEEPVTFDNPASFTVDIASAEVAVSAASLTALMNSYVLAYEDAPIQHVSVAIDKGRLILKGSVRKAVELPFEIDGSVSATPAGEIRIHADKIKTEHIPVKGLLHLFGENLAKLVKNREHGMEIVGDDIILTPETMTPPPHLPGRVASVEIAGGKLIQHFDSGSRRPNLIPPYRTGAYIYHRGGVLRFGKLTMNDADLEIVGNHSRVFQFFQREYKKQLIAGYSKNTAADGLVAHMVDYSRVQASGGEGK